MSGRTTFSLQFPRQVAVTLAVVLTGISYPLFRYAGTDIISGVIAGMVLSVVNVAMGYAAIEYSFNKSYTHFVQVVLGGIAVRLFVMTGALLILIGWLKFHAVALVGSLFAMYVIFLALEVLYIHNKWQQKIQNS